MKIKISIPFVILIAAMYLLDCRSIFLPTFVAVLLHELSHVAAIRLCGGSIELVDIRAFGIRINVPELTLMSYKREIIIAAAGPIAGVITAISAYATACCFDLSFLDYFIGVNIVITAINLIPVYPLDGGRIILSVVLSIFPVRAAYVISYLLSIVSVAGLFCLCFILAIRNSLNPSLVIFSIYIAFCGIKSKARI